MEKNLKYYKELDGVRGIAALMVMFFHFFQHHGSTGPVWSVVQRLSVFGQTGVSLFFVLSGFLITRILLATKSNPNYFSNFYIRRSLRIFPLYYFFLVLVYFIIPAEFGGTNADFSKQIYFWIYLQDFAMAFHWPLNGPGHFWSLAIEEHFYLLWPIMIFYLGRRGIVISVALTILISTFLKYWLPAHNVDIFYFTFTRWDEIGIGALLAVWEIDNKFSLQTSRKMFRNLFLVLVPTLVLWVWNDSAGNEELQVFKYFLIAMIYFFLIGGIISLREEAFFKKLVKTRFFTFTGKISYGLYVYHPLSYLLFFLIFDINYVLVNLLGCFCVAYLLATCSYYALEIWFLRLKRNYG
jgi:peptidoglycan/LPS O-acetylase OafA/YrhL